VHSYNVLGNLHHLVEVYWRFGVTFCLLHKGQKSKPCKEASRKALTRRNSVKPRDVPFQCWQNFNETLIFAYFCAELSVVGWRGWVTHRNRHSSVTSVQGSSDGSIPTEIHMRSAEWSSCTLYYADIWIEQYWKSLLTTFIYVSHTICFWRAALGLVICRRFIMIWNWIHSFCLVT
jgi:hypothetical protein